MATISTSHTIRIPAINWDVHPGVRSVSIPVKVDWPELQLTEDQILANAVALANGENDPYPDRSFIVIEVERPSA